MIMALKSGNVKFKTKGGRIITFLKKEKRALTKAEKKLLKRIQKADKRQVIIRGGQIVGGAGLLGVTAAAAPVAPVALPAVAGAGTLIASGLADLSRRERINKPRKPSMKQLKSLKKGRMKLKMKRRRKRS